MGILRTFEKGLEAVVEGFFARALPGGGVQPVELGKRMVRAMGEEQVKGADGNVYVPNEFLFTLSKKDLARLAQIETTLKKELGAVARRAAAAEKWHLVGSPHITLMASEKGRSGTFQVEARFHESARPEQEAGPQTQLIQMSLAADAELVQIGRNSHTWPISKDEIVLGRTEGCDVLIADPGVSRRHAEIRREGDEWVLLDLGSTNGTEVNGRRINRHRLAPGDRILLGETVLEFRRP